MYNQQWTCLKGEEYWDDDKGILDWECEHPVRNHHGQRFDTSYRTRYGGFNHSGIIYEESNCNVKIAMRRLFRCPGGSLATAKELSDNQAGYIAGNLSFLTQLQKLYDPVMSNFRGFIVEAADHYNDPHKKRVPREQAWKELFEKGTITDDLWLEYTIYKMKKGEIGKFGKEPRMIGDLKVPASLEGFMVTKYLKKAMQEDVLVDDGRIHFCSKPDHSELTTVFNNLMSPSSRVYMALFSDDSCVSVREKDGSVSTYNMDIVSCDASHTGMLFWALAQITTGLSKENIIRLIGQLSTDIRVYDLSRPQRGMDKRYALFRRKDGSPTLYSGSTLTTSVNNLANILIGHSIITSKANSSDEIIAAARAVGYLVTLERCEMPEDIQFLKHSPVLDTTGVYRPVLNIGVLFRSMGTARGDVPGRRTTPLRERFAAFEYALYRGMYPRSHFPFIDVRKSKLKHDLRKVDLQATEVVKRQLEYKVGQCEERHFLAADVYRRYRLSHDEICILDEEIAHMPFDTFHACSAANKVLAKDYGLSCATLYPS